MSAPSPRKAWGGLAIVAALALWAVLVASASGLIGRWHWALQALAYLAAGVGWVPLLMPMARWIETGRFTRPPPPLPPPPDSR